MIEVSIIIPMFNSERWITETMTSVLNQSFDSFEVIIVDDGSTDNSVAIVESYKDSRIRILENAGQKGVSGSRNFGLGIAKGKYVCFLDSDDILLESSLNDRVTLFSIFPNVQVIATDFLSFKDGCDWRDYSSFFQNLKYLDPGSKQYDLSDLGIYIHDPVRFFIAFGCIAWTGTVMAKRDAFNGLWFNESLHRSEDEDMWYRLLKNKPLLFSWKITAAYRRRESSLSSNEEVKLLSVLHFRKRMVRSDELDLSLNIKKVWIKNAVRDISFLYRKHRDRNGILMLFLGNIPYVWDVWFLKNFAMTILGRK